MVLWQLCPACLLGIWDVPSLSLPGPFLGSSCLCPQARPHPAGSPLSFLGLQGSLCAHPTTTPGWQLLAKRHMQRAPCSELDIWPPRLRSPRADPQRLSHSSVCWVPKYPWSEPCVGSARKHSIAQKGTTGGEDRDAPVARKQNKKPH